MLEVVAEMGSGASWGEGVWGLKGRQEEEKDSSLLITVLSLSWWGLGFTLNKWKMLLSSPPHPTPGLDRSLQALQQAEHNTEP